MSDDLKKDVQKAIQDSQSSSKPTIDRIKLGVSDITNTIYIGRVNSKGDQWLEKRDYTDEAVTVVRDYLLEEARRYHQSEFGFEWAKKDGSGTVELTVKINSSNS